MEEQKILNEISHIFIGKDIDKSASNVKAAIITAVSEMAKTSDIISKDITQEEVIELLNAKDNEEVIGLIGMSPNYVKSIIGYSVDFNDYASSMVNYNANKEAYDKLYTDINLRRLNKENAKQL